MRSTASTAIGALLRRARSKNLRRPCAGRSRDHHRRLPFARAFISAETVDAATGPEPQSPASGKLNLDDAKSLKRGRSSPLRHRR
jgi:hypothetical protein